MKKKGYSKHQRDYTLLGTSVVFNAFCSKEMTDYFSVKSSPLFILIENNILYHFISENDAKKRAVSWMKKYKEQDLVKHKKKHDIILAKYKKFLKEKHRNTTRAITTLHDYFMKLLPLIMVAIEVPEYFSENLTKRTLNLCFQIRKQNEFVYKIGFEIQNKLLNCLEKEKKLAKDSLSFLTMPEFNNFVRIGDLPKDVALRQRFILVKKTINSESIFKKPEVIKKMGLIDDEIENVSELKGNIAFKGKVTGLVKIIQLISDAVKIEKGNVLVTSMTDPRYLPIMQKAAAFVTDEGGITCHAAIVARELKKPCIIGTKIATKVLKDGDLVEVDAEKGVVTILKRAEKR